MPRGGLNTFFFQAALPGGGLGIKTTFDAYIVGITDASSPDWGRYHDMGRGDPVVMYNGMSRNVNVSFLVVSESPGDHAVNYLGLKALGALTYPIYRPNQGYNGPHVFFDIGNLISGYGVVSSVDYNWNGDIPWIDEKPIITEVNVSIMILGDKTGKRPEYTPAIDTYLK